MLENKVIRIVAEQLNAAEEYISLCDHFKEDLQANEVEILQIDLALEDEFGIVIKDEEKESFCTVNDIIKFLKKKGITNYPKFEDLLRKRFNIKDFNEVNDSLQKMYLEFAMSTISRGENVRRIISGYVDIVGKRYLDVGCAYGGFLVAFSRAKAKETIGIDINEYLLDYSKALIEDSEVNSNVYNKDILNETEIIELGKFDIITCNDVIEHVDNPSKALYNISLLLEEEGLLFFQIPNRLSSNFIKSDGHFQLFGITTLPKNLADEYYNQLYPDEKHDVTYKSLNYYIDNLNKLGFSCELVQPFVSDINKRLNEILYKLEECKENCKFDNLSSDSIFLKQEIERRISRIYDIYNKQFNQYKILKDMKNDSAQEIANNLINTFGTDFWTIIAKKQ